MISARLLASAEISGGLAAAESGFAAGAGAPELGRTPGCASVAAAPPSDDDMPTRARSLRKRRRSPRADGAFIVTSGEWDCGRERTRNLTPRRSRGNRGTAPREHAVVAQLPARTTQLAMELGRGPENSPGCPAFSRAG